jgi:hypothetical protein
MHLNHWTYRLKRLKINGNSHMQDWFCWIPALVCREVCTFLAFNFPLIFPFAISGFGRSALLFCRSPNKWNWNEIYNHGHLKPCCRLTKLCFFCPVLNIVVWFLFFHCSHGRKSSIILHLSNYWFCSMSLHPAPGANLRLDLFTLGQNRGTFLFGTIWE